MKKNFSKDEINDLKDLFEWLNNFIQINEGENNESIIKLNFKDLVDIIDSNEIIDNISLERINDYIIQLNAVQDVFEDILGKREEIFDKVIAYLISIKK